MTETPAETPTPVDPMKGFRGIAASTLVLEAIVMALALLVIDRLYGGVGTVLGWVIIADVVLLLAACAVLKRRWGLGFVLLLQVIAVACVAGSIPVGVIGILFAGIWVLLLWLRRDVARRMAAGRLPSQR